MGSSESSPFSKQLKNYRVIVENEEHNMSHLSHIETEKEYLLRQLTFNDENVYARSLEAHKKRISLSADHLTHLMRVDGKEIDHLCSNIYKVYAMWEFPYRFLFEEVSERAVNHRKFQQKELWSIFASCIFGMSTLQENKIRHQCLTTKSILLDNDGIVKVCDPLSTSAQTNFDRVYNNRNIASKLAQNQEQSLYLSPEQCESLDNRNSYSNPYKNDIFIMGLILLECGLLRRQNHCFKDEYQRVDYLTLSESLEDFGKEYGNEFKQILQLMLKREEKDRPDWIDLRPYARKEETSIDQNRQEISNNNHTIFSPLSKDDSLHLNDGYLHQARQPPHYPQNLLTGQSAQPSQPRQIQYVTYNTKTPAPASSNPTNFKSPPQYATTFQATKVEESPNQLPSSNLLPNNYQPPQYYRASPYISNQTTFHSPAFDTLGPKPVSNNHESLFTDPQLLMMVRGEAPLKIPNRVTPQDPGRQYKKYETNSNPQDWSFVPASKPPQYESMTYDKGSTANSSQFQFVANDGNLFKSNAPLANTRNQESYTQKEIYTNYEPALSSHPLYPREAENIKEETVSKPNFLEDNSTAKAEYVIQTFKQGSRYEGYKLSDMRHGKGKFYYQDGGLYDGNWSYNKMHGFGSLYYQSGKLAYEGNWSNDQFEGQGKLFNEYPIDIKQEGQEGFDYRDFDGIDDYWTSYEGNFDQDMKRGHGKLFLANGEWFEGQFKDDMVDGRGRFHCHDGAVVEGVWKQNHLQDE